MFREAHTSFQNFAKILEKCRQILEHPSDIKLLEELRSDVKMANRSFLRSAQKPLLGCIYGYLKNSSTLTNKHKELLVETLGEILEKIKIDNSRIFFNIYVFLVQEIFDIPQHFIRPITEEYKLAILKCMIALLNSVDSTILEELYVKKNVTLFSSIIYVCSMLIKKEKSRDIRISAISCIMALARVQNDEDLLDVTIQARCADIFMFYLPGLVSSLTAQALQDITVGHQIPMLVVRAYGRIVSLVMRDYRPIDQQYNFDNANLEAIKASSSLKETPKNVSEINQYLDKSERNTEWFKNNDEKINKSLKAMVKLTHHDHDNVRIEMVEMAGRIVKYCLNTMPQSVCTVMEYLIILSQDSTNKIARRSQTVLQELASDLTYHYNLRNVLESMEDGFYNVINSLPRKFNSIDDSEKVVALNLLIGYLKLFGEHNLNDVLLSANMLNNFLQGLLHVSELEKSNISLLEEYTLKDLSMESTFKSPWLSFKYFQSDLVRISLDKLCEEMNRNNSFEVVYDFLYNTILQNSNKKKEAIYLLNAYITGLEYSDMEKYMPLLKSILNIYTEDPLNDLDLALDSDEYTLEQIQDNFLNICLFTDGIGRLSLILKCQFRPFLLKSLYLVLEKAGSSHPLIRASGLLALQKITSSCEYTDINELISSNFDFLSYHIQKKLVKSEEKEGVMNVLSVVMQYSNADVLVPIKNIIEDVLLHSCDRFKEKYATSYLKVFKIFISSLRGWFKVEALTEKVVSREEKMRAQEQEHFKVSGIDENIDFSDDILEGKTAEEFYREDMAKKEQEEKDLEEENVDDSGYKKPEPPMHIELASLILKRSLHFLPSKIQARKLLVLEILENGVVLLEKWEDELLPITHQIWSPLIERFRDDSDPLIMRLSTRLANVLINLTKTFVRARVVKELLPKLNDTLVKLSKQSYLKDKGSAYRYSQNYKLQHEILSSLALILYNIDGEKEEIDIAVNAVYLYLSDKQPQELQIAAIEFFKIMAIYDTGAIKAKLELLESGNDEYKKNITHVHSLLGVVE